MANKFRDTAPKTEETENKQRPEEIIAPVEKAKKPRKKGVLAKGLSSVFSGTFLTNEKNLKHLPYILFITFLAILYIGNGYYADGKIREFNKTTNEIKELRSDYISTASELMIASKQSEVAKAVEPLGLKEPVVPPIKIEVDSTHYYNSNKTGK